MKNMFFIKETRFKYLWIAFPLVYIVSVCIISLVCFFDGVNPFPLGMLVFYGFFSLLTIISSIYFKQRGLYINEQEIYFKKIKRHYINYKEIKGIKIIKAYAYRSSFISKYTVVEYPLKEKGKQLFSAIIVREVVEEMKTFDKGDIWFENEFKGKVELIKFIVHPVYCLLSKIL